MIYKIYREEDPIARQREIEAEEVEFTGVSIIFWNKCDQPAPPAGNAPLPPRKRDLVARFPETDYIVMSKNETEADDA